MKFLAGIMSAQFEVVSMVVFVIISINSMQKNPITLSKLHVKWRPQWCLEALLPVLRLTDK